MSRRQECHAAPLSRTKRRAVMAALAPVLADTVVESPDGYRLVLGPDLSMTLRNSEGPVRRFSPGWRPGVLLTLFQPVLLLEFVSDAGSGGYWLLDEEGMYLGNILLNLPADLFEQVRVPVALALGWLSAAAAPGLPCDRPFVVDALLGCHLDVRRALAHAVATRAGDPLPPDSLLRDSHSVEAPDVLARVRADLTPGPGWHFVRAVTRTLPVIVLELAHDNGDVGVWYADCHLSYLTNRATDLSGAARRQMLDWCRLWFGQAAALVDGPAFEPGQELAWFLTLLDATRADLFALYTAEILSERGPVWTVADPLPPAMRYTVPLATARSDHAILDPGYVRALCSVPLREQQVHLVRNGTMRWISPIDGSWFEADARCFYLDNLCFAYQVHEPGGGLTFFVIGMAGFFRTVALYFPGSDLVVVLDAHNRAVAGRYILNLRELLLGHLVQYGPVLVPALLAPTGEVVHAFRGYDAIHLGHFVWQDLSGISFLLDEIGETPPPRFLVFDSGRHPEMYGPLEAIFPELDGRVERFEHSFNEHIDRFYRQRQTVVKVTSISVPAVVGHRIVDALHRAPRWQVATARARAAREAGPVVLVGLRVGNRTVTDMAGFAERLVRMLVETLGRVTIVVDGHNGIGDQPGATYASFGDTLTGGSTFLAEEMEIAARLRRSIAGTAATLIDLIGQPIQCSVIWCAEADFFVAPWGAALAKYRWVCNRPGLVLAGRWNIEHRHDLGIYHDPAAMGAPTPMMFNAPQAATDVVVEGTDEARARSDYTLDEAAVFDQVRDLIAAHIRRIGVGTESGVVAG